MNMMTKPQFMTGWMLLTAQPWGKAYRTNTPEATIQLELYYKHVGRANHHVWQAVCEYHAQGERWPSLTELKTSLTNNGGYAHPDQSALPQYFAYTEAPWPLHALWTYQHEHGCTMKDAALAVLPVWIKENPHREDYIGASELLEKAKDNFGIKRQRGNVTAPMRDDKAV